MYDILELSKKLLPELKEIAKDLKILKAESLKKQDLIYKILDQQAIEAILIKSVIQQEIEEIMPSQDKSEKDSDFKILRSFAISFNSGSSFLLNSRMSYIC
jgi:transcription termination factor Rho